MADAGAGEARRGTTSAAGGAVAPAGSQAGNLTALDPYELVALAGSPLIPAEHTLEIQAVTHIALRVNNIRHAEDFYHAFFQMDVVVRAYRTRDHWESLPANFDWDEGVRTGVYPDFVYLRHGPLALLVINAGAAAVLNEQRIAYVALRVSPPSLTALRGEVLVRSFAVTRSTEHELTFRDPFGITWRLSDTAV